MENNIFRRFEDYLEAIKMVVKNNHKEHNNIGRSIRKTNFGEEEITPNSEYFKKCYESNITPEKAIENLIDVNDELFRKINRLPNDVIVDEVDSRYLTFEILSKADTDDLEDELKNRWDSKLVDLYDVDGTDLIDELVRRGQYSAFGKMGTKSIICEALGLNNSFAFSKEEIIAEIEKLF